VSERSVKIGDDERGGWSSDRPRRDGAAARPVDISTRCRVLKVSDRMRYSPGSLVVVVSPSAKERERFVERVFEDRNAVLSPARVRTLLASKVGADELEERTKQLLDAAITKRIANGDSVVVPVEGLESEDREQLARIAHAKRRPRHVVFLDLPAEDDEQRAQLNELRTRLETGGLGAEGFQTALRLSGGALADVKRIVFRQPPRDDD
jgi:predicted kinase